jgi:hypothetical protein
MAGLYAIGVGERGLRVFVGRSRSRRCGFCIRVGRRLFGTRAGFVAALLFSVFYVPVFYGARLLTEMPQVALVPSRGRSGDGALAGADRSRLRRCSSPPS